MIKPFAPEKHRACEACGWAQRWTALFFTVNGKPLVTLCRPCIVRGDKAILDMRYGDSVPKDED